MDVAVEISSAIDKLKAHPFTLADLKAANPALNDAPDSEIKLTIKTMSRDGHALCPMQAWDGPWQLRHYKLAQNKPILAGTTRTWS